MKFLITLTLILSIASQVSSEDGVDPLPMNTPIQADTQNKIKLAKILTILQQGLPETSIFPKWSN